MKKLLILGVLLFAAVGCNSCGHDGDHSHAEGKECCGKDGKCCKK
ncbi:hypothetical protein PQO01_15505 [Lentisphaera marina]|nr:hypothetical protein [Lentisphaera marina]MDD7986355.1 hypothetical protein [Lentisphaera marina]